MLSIDFPKKMKSGVLATPPSAVPVTRAELDALKTEVENLRAALEQSQRDAIREAAALERRMKDATQHEMQAGFEAVKTHLPLIVANAVSGGLSQVELKLDALIEKAKAAEAYRKLREEIEKDVSVRQGISLDFALKKTQLERDVLANQEFPQESKHKRRIGLYGILSGFAVAVLTLIAAALASHK